MKIYTKTGDQGQTGLFGGARVSKDDLRIEAYGTLDELNACLGCALAGAIPPALVQRLVRVQGELFQLGAELATPTNKKLATAPITAFVIEVLEREIDEMETALAPLKTFILPGGSPAASLLHLARTVCRRAERQVVRLQAQESVRGEAIRYLNRLSDYLFVCARWANHQAGIQDTPWISPK